MRTLGVIFLSFFRLLSRVRNKSFSILISGAFARFGKNSTLTLPIRIGGEERISIGDGVFVGADSWIQTLPDGDNRSIALVIADGTSIAASCVISAMRSVVLEQNVLLARNVYISDHSHKYDDPKIPILEQGQDKIRPVRVRRGAWLGQNVVIMPGVTIGVGAVVGANSVVRIDVPDHCIAVGAPARVVKAIQATVTT